MSKDLNWTQFFKDAGVPLPMAKRYSATFEDNRIAKDMLMDLNKEILISMGITAMGDVINILKHAKKTYSLDIKKKETLSSPVSKTLLTSNKCPPPPTAHSTTAGQTPAVSTTSATTKKKTVLKHKKEYPDSPQEEVAYVGYIIDSGKKGVVLESNISQPSEDDLQEPEEFFLEAGPPQEEPTEEVEAVESYQTQGYASQIKRPFRMYSDDVAPPELPQAKQPRVIILPGERQDIFTTSGLQKAAKVYESGEEQEGKLTTDRSRRLLESAGLIPTKDKSASVFSRLDYKPSVTSHLTPVSQQQQRQQQRQQREDAREEPPQEASARRRIINLTKPTAAASIESPRKVTSSSSRKISSTTIAPKTTRKIISTASSSSSPSSSSLPSKVLVKRLVSSKEEPKPISARLGMKRGVPSVIASTISDGAESQKRSGLFGYEGSQKRGVVSSGGSGGGLSSSLASAGVRVHSSMVADEYEYQTQRQHDIRSRLEVKEMEKRARRGGPLVGRLDRHKVFGRLE